MKDYDRWKDWDTTPRHPDPETDLGYEGEDWETVSDYQDGDLQVKFLPEDHKQPEEDESYIAVSVDDLYTLEEEV